MSREREKKERIEKKKRETHRRRGGIWSIRVAKGLEGVRAVEGGKEKKTSKTEDRPATNRETAGGGGGGEEGKPSRGTGGGGSLPRGFLSVTKLCLSVKRT